MFSKYANKLRDLDFRQRWGTRTVLNSVNQWSNLSITL